MKTSIILFILAIFAGFHPDLINLDRSRPLDVQVDTSNVELVVKRDTSVYLNASEESLVWNNQGQETLLAPMITANKSMIMVGADSGPAGPSAGDTIQYTVDITSGMSGMDALGVRFSDMIDANSTLVPGSINTSPIAVNDTYSTVGNVSISVPVANGLLANDIELDGDVINVTTIDVIGTQGNVVANPDGSFTFNPAPGFEGVTSFTYNLSDGVFTRSGTVSINVSGMIWFINSGAPMGGDGRLGSPFNSVSSFSASAADDANDNIFIYTGNYSGSITLLSGQNLIGQGAVGTLANLAGVTFSLFPPIAPSVIPVVGGVNPVITNASTTLTTGMDNDIYGLTINNMGGTALTGNNLGTLKIRDMILSNTAGVALNLTNGTVDLVLKSVSASNANYGIRLQTTSGSMEVTGTGTADASGGTFNAISVRGIELINATNITLRNMTLTNANTIDSGFDGVCDEDDNINCNAAIYLNSVNGITLNNVDITTTEEHGINGNNVTNLNLINCTSTGNGNSNEENALKLRNLFGTCVFSGSTFSLSAFRIAHIINTSGTLNLTVDNCTFNNTIASAVGQDCFEMRTQGSANATVNLKNSNFQRARSKGIQAIAEGSSTFNLNVTNCTIQRFSGNMAGIEVGSVGTATINYNINGNQNIEAANEVAVLASTLNSSILNGRVNNNSNILKQSSVPTIFSDMRMLQEGNSTARLEIKNNANINLINGETAVQAISRIGTMVGASKLDFIVDGNTVTTDANSVAGIETRSGQSSTGMETNVNCTYVVNNLVTAASPVAFRARILNGTAALNLQGVGPDVATNWGSNGNTNVGGTIGAFVQPPSVINFGGMCVPPVHALPPPPPTFDETASESSVAIDTGFRIQNTTGLNEIASENGTSIEPLLTFSGETVSIGGMTGFLLPQNKNITIVFRVKIDDPLPDGVCMISNQGSVSGSNFSTILTDDPSIGGTSDPTVTNILIPPSITDCQDNINVFTDPNQCTASLAFSSTSTGCPMPTLTYKIMGNTISSPHLFPIGVTTVDVTASNGVTPDATCSFIVTVTDEQIPVLTCLPGIQQRSTDAMVCSYTVQGSEFDPMVDENCPGYILTNNLNGTATLAGEILTPGMHSITWSIMDAVGLTDQCTVVVEVSDPNLPTMSCQTIVSTSCDINDIPPYSDLTEFTLDGGSVSDNCGIDNASFKYLGQTGGPDTYIRTYQIEDIYGNKGSCMQSVTLRNIVMPVVTNVTATPANYCFSGGSTLMVTGTLGDATEWFWYSETCEGTPEGIGSSIIVSPTTTTTYFVRGEGGCVGTAAMCSEVMVTVNTLSVTIDKTDAGCAGSSQGVATAVPSGGSGSYSYLWSNGSTFQSNAGLVAGTYGVTVTDLVTTCEASELVIINEPSALTLSSTQVNVLCNGDDNGSIDVTASGGTPGYTYAWTNGATTQDVSDLTAGTYTITVTDAMFCTKILAVTITQPSRILLSTNKVNVDCGGNSTGSIDLTVNGGTPAYTYAWSNGATTQDINNLVAGTYTVTVTDANSCQQTSSTTITEPPAITLIKTQVNVLCNAAATGSIDLSVSGGTPGYTYAWSNGATTQDVSGLASGTYTVTVTDANTCTKTISAVITEPAPISLSSTEIDVLCNGLSTGAIDLTVIGGTAGYTYAWSNGATTQDISGLVAGTYTVTVTDANNCAKTLSKTISQPSSLSLSTTKENVYCNGLSTGAIDLTVLGGTAGYTYAWSNGATTQDIGGLVAGTYTVTVTDANNCTKTSSTTITEPSSIILTKTQVNVLCNGAATGSIDLSVSGGTPGYTYAWSNGATTQDVNGLIAGTYTVTVTDANSCPKYLSVTITEPGPITANFIAPADLCLDAGIQAGLGGGNPAQGSEAGDQGIYSGPGVTDDGNGLTYSFDPMIAGLGLHTITYTYTNGNGCVTSASDDIAVGTVPNGIGNIIGPVTICPLLKNLGYSIAAVSSSISYTWSFSDPSATISGNGTNQITITFDETFSGGTLSVTADNTCGPSISSELVLVEGSALLCDLASCLSESQALIIDNTLLNGLGSLDVFQNYNRIESNATVETSRRITFKAGNEILLNPPFSVEYGATFIAEIESCFESISKD